MFMYQADKKNVSCQVYFIPFSYGFLLIDFSITNSKVDMRTGRNTLQGWDSLRSEGPQAGGVPSGPEFGFRAFAAVARVRSLLGELRASKPAMQCDKKKRTKTAATTHARRNVQKKEQACGQCAEVFDLKRGHFPPQCCKLTACATRVITRL